MRVHGFVKIKIFDKILWIWVLNVVGKTYNKGHNSAGLSVQKEISFVFVNWIKPYFFSSRLLPVARLSLWGFFWNLYFGRFAYSYLYNPAFLLVLIPCATLLTGPTAGYLALGVGCEKPLHGAAPVMPGHQQIALFLPSEVQSLE